MTTYAALLRNVNVGGKRIAMPALRAIFEAAGCDRVATYVQSGNVVFRSGADPAALMADVEVRVKDQAGFEAPVVLRTRGELAAAVAARPWPQEALDPKHLVVVFCRREPDAAAVERLRGLAAGGEEVVTAGREVFLRLPHGQGRSKLVAALGRADLGGPATARNWRTVTSVLALADSLETG